MYSSFYRACNAENRCVQLWSGAAGDFIGLLCREEVFRWDGRRSYPVGWTISLQQATTASCDWPETWKELPKERSSKVCGTHPPMPWFRPQEQTINDWSCGWVEGLARKHEQHWQQHSELDPYSYIYPMPSALQNTFTHTKMMSDIDSWSFLP